LRSAALPEIRAFESNGRLTQTSKAEVCEQHLDGDTGLGAFSRIEFTPDTSQRGTFVIPEAITRRRFIGNTVAVGLGVLAHPTFSTKVFGPMTVDE
jgi:hypothetical protein